MSTAADKRARALSSALSTPFFAPTPPRRAGRALKNSIGDIGVKRHGITMHAMDDKAYPMKAPEPWNPAKSTALRQYGYTMTSQDLQPGMTVTQWPGQSSHTIGTVNHLAEDNSQLNYTDGSEAIVSRNASFAQGIPQQ